MPSLRNIIHSHEYGGTTLITEDDKHIIKETTNVTALRDHVAGLREANHQVGHRVGSQNHMRHLAEVPMSVYNQAMREQWDWKRWRQWLNDPDNAPLRVTKGRV